MTCTTHPPTPKEAPLNDDVIDTTACSSDPSDEEELDVPDTHYEVVERNTNKVVLQY